MGKWFPRIYDMAMTPLEQAKFKKVRKILVSEATGRVLEIGSGTGANFPYYKNATRVDAIEPNPLMRKQSFKRIKRSRATIKTYLVKAEKLPFEENTFDSVVATLVFCTIPDPVQALKEIQRVSKPGASLFLLEHVRMNHLLLGRMQDVLTPLWQRACDGCHLNRDTLGLLKRMNVSISRVDSIYRGFFLSIKCSNNSKGINDYSPENECK
ncbi:class I SAM-dependent methyltransferase [Halobacillus shinanisalinarum]|uniref:Class I SAM-dependent methyltransferase n=1 Tax=Halobacillus shinanisalinarum TaxID=2932258 RepID=A0ABY4GZ48_9BACI|nr:class I SAM-dependent methyltransferase [Halobacillus shinanisalinarum]UOQ93301.1 class I SAM-dependent methyltransferase [Halobacillus shinanisalinarum]